MHAVTECKLVSTVFYCLVFIAVGDFNLIHAKRYAVTKKYWSRSASERVYFKIKPLSGRINDKDPNTLHIRMYAPIQGRTYIHMQLWIHGQTFPVPSGMHINCCKCHPLLCLSPTHTSNSYAQYTYICLCDLHAYHEYQCFGRVECNRNI